MTASGEDATAGAPQGATGGMPARRTGWLDLLAIVGLLLVWPVGAVLLWRSRVWSRGAKLVGTLVPPCGYALPLIGAWTVFRVGSENCTASYDAYGQLISSTCRSDVVLSAADLALTIFVNGVGLIWLLLPIASAVFLVTRAWPWTAGALRPMLVLAVAAVPPIALAIVAAGAFVSLGAPTTATTTTSGPQPHAEPSVQVVAGPPAFPNLTQAQLAAALHDRGLSCEPPVQTLVSWTTDCRGTGSVVTAEGSDEHAVEAVMATLFSQGGASGTGDASQFLATVVQAACSPGDAAPITAWVRDHLAAGGETDIDGYHLTIIDTAVVVALTIARSHA